MSDSETIPQMRERIAELEKQVKAQTSQVEALSVENRTLKARDIFRDLGYRPEVAETFVKATEGDPTPDSVDAFAQQLGLSKVAAESGADGGDGAASADGGGSSEPPADSALAQMARGGSGPGSGGQPPAGNKPMPRAEWIELSKTDPGQARQVLAEGRVEIRGDNPFAARR